MITAEHYELTIDELSQEVVRLLKVNNILAVQHDNRVSAAPDMRTIRYYSSLGLIDRPSIQGRVAKYNRRHVLQLLAIKTLQGASLPLSEIQERLYGLSDDELEAVVASYASETSKGINQHTESLRTVYWREIVLEPGLKISADDSWIGEIDQEQLERKFRAAIETFRTSARGATENTK